MIGWVSREHLKKLRAGPYPTNDVFRKIAGKTAHNVGSPGAFVGAATVVFAWAVTGPLFHFSDTWQLVINTGTTIVTFLMVFLIQNTQNRDSYAIHLKLDELIRANALARNSLMGAEDLTDAELLDLHMEFDRLAREKLARHRRESTRHPDPDADEEARAPADDEARASTGRASEGIGGSPLTGRPACQAASSRASIGGSFSRSAPASSRVIAGIIHPSIIRWSAGAVRSIDPRAKPSGSSSESVARMRGSSSHSSSRM